MTVASLWMPVLASSVLVFLASWILHAVMKHHANDHAAVPDEDALRDALRPFDLPPGQYVVPKPAGAKEMASGEYRDKARNGPALLLTIVRPESLYDMRPGLAKWFGYCVLVAVLCAYLASRTLEPGADYLAVFRVVGAVSFACFAVGEFPRSIWWSQKWSTTLKTMGDGLVYALVSAGAFGWLWPG